MPAKSRFSVILAVTLIAAMLLAFDAVPALADTWSQVATGGISPNYNELQTRATATAVYSGHLYVGTEDTINGCEVWQTSAAGGPPYTDWVQVNVDGFGNPNNTEVTSMKVFQAKLYVGTLNRTTGCEIWVYNGANWSCSVGNAPGALKLGGFGNPAANLGALSMEVDPINNYLWVGTGIRWGAPGPLCEVWYYNPWLPIPSWICHVGTVGPFPPGFGPPNSGAVSMAYFVNPGPTPCLYIGTENFFSLCEVWEINLNTGAVAPIVFGAPAPPNPGSGFGSPAPNIIASSMAVFGGNLYVGTFNPAGCEVWLCPAPGLAPWACTVGPPITGALTPPGFGVLANIEASSLTLVNAGAVLYAGTQNPASGCEVWSSLNGVNWACLIGLGPGALLPGGFGSVNNTEAPSITEYAAGSNNVYIGTNNQVGGSDVWARPNAGLWARVNTSGFTTNTNQSVLSAAQFGSALYIGTGLDAGSGRGCEVWKTTDATTFSRVVGQSPPGTPATGPGFGNPANDGAASMAVFGSNLYVGTYNPNGCEVWTSPDGTNWSCSVGPTGIVGNGFGNANNLTASSMAVLGSNLYVGTVNRSTGCEVWRSPDGVNWTCVVGPVPGNPGFRNTANNWKAASMAIYGGSLYAGTGNGTSGCEVYSSPDGATWTCLIGPTGVLDSGFSLLGFPNANNSNARCQAVFGTGLYFGVDNSTTGCELWTYSGGAWSCQVGVFPGNSGFGSANNTGAASMVVFGRRLLVGTENSTGCQAWRSFDGANWTQATTASGFGNVNNRSACSMGVLGPDLLVGTGNSIYGCDIYRENVAVTSLGTASGRQGERLNVVVNGSNTSFASYSSPTFGSGITVNGVAVTNDTQLTADITIQPDAALGTRDVNVITGNETPAPLVGSFTVTNGTPSITSISPDNGPWGTEVTVNGTNFGTSRGTGFVTFGGVQSTEYTAWGDGQLKCKVPTDISAGKVQVSVTTAVGTSNAKDFTVNPAVWYLAEGTTDWGFSEYVTIENPNPEAVTAHVTYMTKSGPKEKADINLPASSQTTINPKDDIGATDFSTAVTCTDGKTIAVDRTMTWTGTGAASPEAHNSVGVTSPAKTWYLAEGSSAWGFECWLLIQNPNSSEATCNVTYMIEGSGPQTFIKKVPASSRATFNMADDIGEKDASIKVEADIPVIPERAMYRNNRREGHDSIGTTAPATDYFLAEGTTDYGFTTYVLVQNPNPSAANVTVTYMTNAGPQPQAPFSMPANSRKTIRVNDILPSKDLSTQVHADQPIIAERAMYWGEGKPLGEACHDSIGMAEPHTTFYLPDGQSSEGRETWTLVQNPNDTDVSVEISYLTSSGTGNQTFADTIPASSRKTYNMADKGINGRAAIMVTCTTSGKKIMVERAMYWNSRGAGTDTIGGYSD